MCDAPWGKAWIKHYGNKAVMDMDDLSPECSHGCQKEIQGETGKKEGTVNEKDKQ